MHDHTRCPQFRHDWGWKVPERGSNQIFVLECCMTKSYVLWWYYCNGRSGVVELGPPTDVRWRLGGVPGSDGEMPHSL